MLQYSKLRAAASSRAAKNHDASSQLNNNSWLRIGSKLTLAMFAAILIVTNFQNHLNRRRLGDSSETSSEAEDTIDVALWENVTDKDWENSGLDTIKEDDDQKEYEPSRGKIPRMPIRKLGGPSKASQDSLAMLDLDVLDINTETDEHFDQFSNSGNYTDLRVLVEDKDSKQSVPKSGQGKMRSKRQLVEDINQKYGSWRYLYIKVTAIQNNTAGKVMWSGVASNRPGRIGGKNTKKISMQAWKRTHGNYEVKINDENFDDITKTYCKSKWVPQTFILKEKHLGKWTLEYDWFQDMKPKFNAKMQKAEGKRISTGEYKELVKWYLQAEHEYENSESESCWRKSARLSISKNSDISLTM